MVMSRQTSIPAPSARDAAITERGRNVLVDAGAGTGKTSLLVDRFVEMVAPGDGATPMPIERLAAITFTRKAAGELRLRIRERLLAGLAQAGLPEERARQLRAALAGLDTAYVGTIHSFADRLLRLRPVEAQLSPAYEVAEDDDALVRETFELLLHAVQAGTLETELAGTPAAGRATEAARTLLFALHAGIPSQSRDREWSGRHGLDHLVAGFIDLRDVPPPDGEPAAFDADAFRTAADEFIRLARSATGSSRGARWIQGTARLLERLRASTLPEVVLRELRAQIDREPRGVTKRDTFAGEDGPWKVWKRWDNPKDDTPLRETLLAPPNRWLATRLARLFPVAVALYEKVKTRRQALDQLDLLLKLRDLLRDHLDLRGEFQRLFDHIFVDEFQDTDPLQAEIILYLCERTPAARAWEDIALRDGALTLVGDPKQSIYRFRRADVGTYDRVRELVLRHHPLEVALATNYRSVPRLIDWLNDRFDRILGVAPGARPFEPATGQVFQQRLGPGREGTPGPAVHVMPLAFGDADKPKADDCRRLEGEALARYLRWLVERSGLTIVDPVEDRARPVRYGDVAVLAVTTYRLPLLFPALDAEGIPYASRGGTLFLDEPLHRQFLLGLRALADRDDGVAEAALLRPPFFAVDLADLALEAHAEPDDGDERVARVRQAREVVRELRRRRFEQPPGATARDLLDRTGFAFATALGPNGIQRLARLRELCLILEQRAAGEGLDYDAVTARARAWVTEPIQLDPPHPVGAEAVRVLTVHQAKGLEFPVVVLWDGVGEWQTRIDHAPWRVERNGAGWTISLDGFAWEEPAGLALRETERGFLDWERRRVIYVAATRARDLLVVPRAPTARPAKHVCADLLTGADPALMREMEPYVAGAGAPWARTVPVAAGQPPADPEALERQVSGTWEPAAAEAARPRFAPASVSEEAQAALADTGLESAEPAARKPRPGRFGPVFGAVVHEAIGLALRDPELAAAAAVRSAAELYGLAEHLEEAAADVTRALDALCTEGLGGRPGPERQLEYPIAGVLASGQLLGGYIDLIGVTHGQVTVLDFKTDAPPTGLVEETYPAYAAQVSHYAHLIEVAGLVPPGQTRCGLLFAADGCICWVSPEGAAR
jgi:ATP-dependent helicase/nuclease subunit A